MEKNKLTWIFRFVLFAKNLLLVLLFTFFTAKIVSARDEFPSFERFPSGQLKSETVGSGPEKNSTTTYFDSGQKQAETLMYNGKKTTYSEWYESGTKKEEIHYKDGMASRMTVWSPKGVIESTSIFASDGTRTDTFFYSNGNKKLEQSTKDRQPAGTWTKWAPDGKKILEKTYEDKEQTDTISDEDRY